MEPLKISKRVNKWSTLFGVFIVLGFWGGIGALIYNNSNTSTESLVPVDQSIIQEEQIIEPYSTIEDDIDTVIESENSSSYSSLSDCNENYSGCVEDSEFDLDCIDVDGEVEVIGYDEYRLDGDGDGWGCE